jgi:hypothetical protein
MFLCVLIASHLSVVVIENQTLCHDVCVVDQQVDSVILFANEFKDSLDLCLIGDVTLEGKEFACHAE